MFTKYVLCLDSLASFVSLATGEIINNAFIRKNYPRQGSFYDMSPRVALRKTERREVIGYDHSFQVWVDGRQIGLLGTDCPPPMRPAARFSFDNEVLYTAPGFLHYVGLLETECNLVPVGLVPYFEIALDLQLQEMLLFLLSDMERHSTLDKYNKEPKFRPLRKKTVCNKLISGTTYTFGHGARGGKGAGKQVEVYCKSDQIREQNYRKLYILQYHAANGLDPEIPTERIEVRGSSRWLKECKLYPTLADFARPEMLETLFRRAIGDVFKFVEIDPEEKPKRNAQGNYKPLVTTLFAPDFLQAKPVTFPAWEKPVTTGSESNNRITHKTLVQQFVQHGTAATRDALTTFEALTVAPAGTDWPTRRLRYATAYEGERTRASKYRIANIGALLSPDNNQGVSTRRQPLRSINQKFHNNLIMTTSNTHQCGIRSTIYILRSHLNSIGVTDELADLIDGTPASDINPANVLQILINNSSGADEAQAGQPTNADPVPYAAHIYSSCEQLDCIGERAKTYDIAELHHASRFLSYNSASGNWCINAAGREAVSKAKSTQDVKSVYLAPM